MNLTTRESLASFRFRARRQNTVSSGDPDEIALDCRGGRRSQPENVRLRVLDRVARVDDRSADALQTIVVECRMLGDDDDAVVRIRPNGLKVSVLELLSTGPQFSRELGDVRIGIGELGATRLQQREQIEGRGLTNIIDVPLV